MIQRIIKKINGKRYIINIPVFDINSFVDSGGEFNNNSVNITPNIVVEIFRITENNVIRMTENDIERILE